MWSSAHQPAHLASGRSPRVSIIATEESLIVTLETPESVTHPLDDSQTPISEIAMAEIHSIELEGRATNRSSFDWELLTGFAAEREPAVTTTGMLIRSYRNDFWVLRLDGDPVSVTPRLAALLARKERQPLPA
jgi:hypothetical protein